MLAATLALAALQCGAPAVVGAPVVGCQAGVIPGVIPGSMEVYHCPQTQELVLWAYTATSPPTIGYFFGSQRPGFWDTPFHNGYVCMGLPAVRWTGQPFMGNPNGHPIHLSLAQFVPGDTWWFQGWYYELCDHKSAFTDGRVVTVP